MNTGKHHNLHVPPILMLFPASIISLSSFPSLWWILSINCSVWGIALNTGDTQIKRTQFLLLNCCQLYLIFKVSWQFENNVIIFLKPKVRLRGVLFSPITLWPFMYYLLVYSPYFWLFFLNQNYSMSMNPFAVLWVYKYCGPLIGKRY